MDDEFNESILCKIDINTNEENDFFTPLNKLNSLILKFFQISITDYENIAKLIKSFQNEFSLKSISNGIVIEHNSNLLKKINYSEKRLTQYFEKAKNLFQLMKEKKQLLKINGDDTINELSQELSMIKEYNEKLIKEIGAKNLIQNQLDLEILELKDILKSSNQNQKMKELNEEIKRISFEKEQMEKILERNGIQVVGGEEINIPKNDIIEKYQNEIEKLRKKVKNLEDMADFSKQNKQLIESSIYSQNSDLIITLAKNDEEIKSLKKHYENVFKENENLKSIITNNGEEINSLKEKNRKLIEEINDLNTKFRELEKERYNKNNKILNNLNNININNKISLDENTNKLRFFIKENEKLKNENKKLKNENENLKNEKRMLTELNIESIKRSCFENPSELEKIPEKEYNNEEMSNRAKIIDNIQNINVDFPDISTIIAKYKEFEYNNKMMNCMINKSKDLLRTETNNKKLRLEFSKILG